MPAKKEAKNRRANPDGRHPGHRHPHPPGRSAPSGAGRTGPNQATLGILPALLAIALYLPTVSYGWVWDDSLLVARQGAGGVGAEGFRLLASLFYRLEWRLGFGTPVLAHFFSVLLHGLAAWLFFRLAIQVGATVWIALAAGLLFAAHPVHVEAVAYVSGRPDLLATVFALLALLVARTPELCSPEGCRSWKIWPAYVALVGAVLSDEVAIVTPLVLVALDRWGPVRVPWRRRMTHYAGFFAIVLVYLLVRYTAGGGATPAPGTAQSSSGIDPAARTWAVPMALLEYLKMLAWPHPLNALRSLHAADIAAWSAKLAPAAALVALALFVAWRARDPVARAGAILLLLPLLPALPLPFLVGSFGEERAVYFASVGFCLLVGSFYAWCASVAPAPRPALMLGAVGIAAVASLGTLDRLPVWRDNVSLLQAAVKAAPADPSAHLMLLEHYLQAGDLTAALAEADAAIATDPRNHIAYAKKATLTSRLGRYAESEAASRKAIGLDPRDAISYANLSNALLHLGRIPPAVDAARRSVEIDSTLASTWYNYGVALSASGDYPGSIHAYERALAIDPNNAESMNNLGALLGATGRLEEARDLYLRLTGIAPNSLEAKMNLALAYLRLGDRENAAKQRDIVRTADPASGRRLDVIFADYVKTHPFKPPPKASR